MREHLSMPTYSYKCNFCDNVMAVIQSMSDSTLDEYHCDSCNKRQKVQKIISGGSGMIFKGSGFYLTDYTEYGKKSKKKENNKSDSQPAKNKEKKKKDLKT